MSSSRKAAIHECSPFTNDPNSSQEWDVREILDEKGPAGGKDGRYLLDWEDNPSGTRFAPSWERKDGCTPALIREWKRKKAADPTVVGRHGGEAEERYISSRMAGTRAKRSRSRVVSNASHEPSSDVDEPNAKKRRSQLPTGPRLKHGWEYVEISSQEPKPLKISIEKEIRRRKKEGLPPLSVEELEEEKPNIRATRIRSRDASGSKPPPARQTSHGRKDTPSTVSPKAESRTGATPTQVKNGEPSRVPLSSPSRNTVSRDKNLPAKPHQASKKASIARYPSPTKGRDDLAPETSSKQAAIKSTNGARQLSTRATNAETTAVPAPTVISRTSPSKTLSPTKSAPTHIHFPTITGSQFKTMLPRSPSPSQHDAIVPFTSPVAASGRKAQKSAQPAPSGERPSADDEQVDSSLEVREESASQESKEEDVQAEIITEIVDGVEVTRMVTESMPNPERMDGAEEGGSSQESSEADISHLNIDSVMIDGEEIVGIIEKPAVADGVGSADVPLDDKVRKVVESAADAAVENAVEVAPVTAEIAVEPAMKELPAQSDIDGAGAVKRTAAAAEHGPKVDETALPSEAVRDAILSTLDHVESAPSEPIVTVNTDTPHQPTSTLSAGDLTSRDQQIANQASRIQELEQEVSRLQNSYNNALYDNNFLRKSYQDASNKAVEEVHRNNALEEEMTILRGQLKFGLKQKEMVGAAVEKKRQSEMDRLRMQSKVLLDQARLTDDDVRRRASAYGKMKYERDQLLQKNGELHQKYESLSERNEELVDQVHYFRAKEMGVFGSDSEEDDEDYQGQDDSDDEYPNDPLDAISRRTVGGSSRGSAQGETSRHGSLANGSGASTHEDVFTVSQIPSNSQATYGPPQEDQGVYRSGVFMCKWMAPERCTAVFDDKEAFGRHVEAHADDED